MSICSILVYGSVVGQIVFFNFDQAASLEKEKLLIRIHYSTSKLTQCDIILLNVGIGKYTHLQYR